jgi:hypothetical protein
MRHAISRSQTVVEIAIAMWTAAVSATAVLLLGVSGTVQLLGPEDAEVAGIRSATSSSR